MKFNEFVQSRVWQEDLSKVDVGAETGTKGWLYADSFWIAQADDGQWDLILGNQEWLDADLGKLERILWEDFANGEINGEPV